MEFIRGKSDLGYVQLAAHSASGLLGTCRLCTCDVSWTAWASGTALVFVLDFPEWDIDPYSEENTNVFGVFFSRDIKSC